jgi:hypothetical protein
VGGREDLAQVTVVIDHPPLGYRRLSLPGPDAVYLEGVRRRGDTARDAPGVPRPQAATRTIVVTAAATAARPFLLPRDIALGPHGRLGYSGAGAPTSSAPPGTKPTSSPSMASCPW